jgi:superfamily I DNA and/or RNA helicase
VGTVDSFQGKEFDVVFLSAVRSNSIQGNSIQALRKKFGHLTTENRLCVAMSRQKRHLVVVGDQQMFSDDLAKEHVHGLWRFNELCSSQEGRVIHD